MKIRYIADMHFDYEDIIAYDNRPFNNAGEMNELLISNWNRTVSGEDLTWILGDFCGGDQQRWREILSRLNGRKALIFGNHDPYESYDGVKELFEDAAEYREISDNGRKVILCHYPILSFHDHYLGSFHLYGHVHMSYDWNVTENAKRLMRNLYMRNDVMRMLNVGAMLPYMDFTPRTLDELIPHI